MLNIGYRIQCRKWSDEWSRWENHPFSRGEYTDLESVTKVYEALVKSQPHLQFRIIRIEYSVAEISKDSRVMRTVN